MTVDSKDTIYRGGKDALDLLSTKELASPYYPSDVEEMDVNFPNMLLIIDEVESTIFVAGC